MNRLLNSIGKEISLKMKLLIGGVLVSILPLIIVGYLAMSKASSSLVKGAKFQCVQMAKDLAMLTENVIEKDKSFAMAIVRIPVVTRAIQKVYDEGQESSEPELNELKKLLVAIHEKTVGTYENLFVLDKDGTILSDSIGVKEKVGSLGGRTYFKEAKKGKMSLSSPLISPATGQRLVILCLPIENSAGDFAGAFAVAINLEILSNTISKVKLGETGIPFMISKAGLTIAHPDTKKILKVRPGDTKGMEAYAKRMTDQESGVEFYEFSGGKKIVGFAPVKSTGWSIGITQDESEFMAPARSIRNLIMLVGGFFLIAVLCAVFWFAKGIMTQLGGEPKYIAGIADSIAAGDLTLEFYGDAEKLTGVYASMKKMTENLSGMITHITGGVGTLTSSSMELSAISDQVASNAEQTSERAGSVAAASEEMSANINSVAAATEQTTANIQTIVSAIEEMSSTIKEIAKNTAKGSETTTKAVSSAKTVSGKVDELGKAASEINKITDTIADISEQTNLLALNATIEAARAGEAGKGFAVVAGEIKALAQQTAEATSEISDKISGVQATTQESVEAITSIVTIINEINEIVTTVATAIEEQSATTQEISNNVAQAANGVQEVNENVNQASAVVANVNQDVSQVSQSAEEMKTGGMKVKSSAAQLSDLAGNLNEMISRFKI